MDIYKLKWTSLQSQIFSLLSIRAGEEFSQREIAKLLNVSPTAVANSLKMLTKEEIIIIKKIKNINLVTFNRDSHHAIDMKRAENLKNLFLAKIIDHLEVQLAGSVIVLFGSYSYGMDTNDSDIDIAVIGRKDRRLDLEKYEELLYRKINVNFYDSFKDIHTNLKNNILNGIVLKGVIEL
jgi:predicted nucleotidyltransferase